MANADEKLLKEINDENDRLKLIRSQLREIKGMFGTFGLLEEDGQELPKELLDKCREVGEQIKIIKLHERYEREPLKRYFDLFGDEDWIDALKINEAMLKDSGDLLHLVKKIEKAIEYYVDKNDALYGLFSELEELVMSEYGKGMLKLKIIQKGSSNLEIQNLSDDPDVIHYLFGKFETGGDYRSLTPVGDVPEGLQPSKLRSDEFIKEFDVIDFLRRFAWYHAIVLKRIVNRLCIFHLIYRENWSDKRGGSIKEYLVIIPEAKVQVYASILEKNPELLKQLMIQKFGSKADPNIEKVQIGHFFEI